MRRAVRANFGHAVVAYEAFEFSGPRISPPDLPRQRPDFGNLLPNSRMTPNLRCRGNSALGGTNAAAGFTTRSFSFYIDHLTSRKNAARDK